MPIIETDSGEGLIVKRLGIEYLSVEGNKYSIDSEPVASEEYDIAVYIDTLVDDLGNPVNLEKNKSYIVNRVKDLSGRMNINLRFFADFGEIYNAAETKFPTKMHIVNPTSLLNEKLGEIIKNEDKEHLRKLIEQNPELLTEKKLGFKKESLLHFLSGKGKVKLCELLLNMGVDPDIAGFNSETPLVRAANNGHLDTVKALLNGGANVNGLPEGVATPLIAAAANGNVEILKFLLLKGADANRKDRDINQTAMEIAQNFSREEVIKILKEVGS